MLWVASVHPLHLTPREPAAAVLETAQTQQSTTARQPRGNAKDYCEREVDELELQGGTVYLHLGARRDEAPRH